MVARRVASIAAGVSLAALAIVTGCQIEVNINTDPDRPAPDPIVTTAPDAPAPPPIPDAPPAPVAPRVQPPPPPAPTEDVIRDALLRYDEPTEREGPQQPGIEEIREEPTFTPFTEAPTILNRMEVIETMERSYPPLLREAGIGGTVRVYFLIDRDGAVVRTLLDQSSGHQALDDAALSVASVYRFSPAKNRSESVPVWVSFPITFRVD